MTTFFESDFGNMFQLSDGKIVVFMQYFRYKGIDYAMSLDRKLYLQEDLKAIPLRLDHLPMFLQSSLTNGPIIKERQIKFRFLVKADGRMIAKYNGWQLSYVHESQNFFEYMRSVVTMPSMDNIVSTTEPVFY